MAPIQRGPLLCLVVLLLAPDDTLAQGRVRDSLPNGAVMGAAVGAAAGTAITHALRDSDLVASQYARGAIIFAGFGAATGIGIDALFERGTANGTRRRVTVTPVVSRQITAARVELRW